MSNPNGPMVAAAHRNNSTKSTRLFYASVAIHNLANSLRNTAEPAPPNLVADAEASIQEASIVIAEIKSGK